MLKTKETTMYRSLYLPLILSIFIFSACEHKTEVNSDAYDTSPRHLRVIWTENPANHAIISWTTMVESAKNNIYYDTLSRGGDMGSYSFTTNSERDGKISMRKMDRDEAVPEGWYQHGQVSDLEPSTKYYFVVESDGKVSEEHHFLTAPVDDSDFKILSGGDSRMGGEKPRYAGRTPHVDRQAMNRVILNLFEENPDIMALAHGADWGTTADWRHLYWWFEDNEIIKTSENRLLPFIVARGNHDEEIGFQENFWLGEITDQLSFGYYFTTKISKLALITLNTEISVAGDQREWLEEELQEMTSAEEKPRWIMAQYHRPAYPVAKEFDRHTFARVRNAWTPLFDQFNLDLALESDGHLLKRTMPIRNFKPAADGVVYIGEGGLGVPQRVPIPNLWFVESPGIAKTAHHVWLLDIKKDSLTMKAIGMDMQVEDQYTMYPRSR